MENKQPQQKAHHDVATQPHKFQKGEEVYLRNFGRWESWFPGWIVNRISSVSFLIRGLDGQTFRRHQDHLCPRRGDGTSGTNQSTAELPVDDSTVEAMPTKSSSSEESSSLVSYSVHNTSAQASHPAVSSGNSVQASHPSVSLGISISVSRPSVSSTHRYPQRNRMAPDRYRP